MAPLDVEATRDSFPALRQTQQVYLDNAGGSQTLGTVIDAIRNYLAKTNVQLGATYAVSQTSTELYDQGYAAAAKYINASVEEIVLGSATTQLFRNFSFTLDFSAGDEIVVSSIDHEANIAPWVDLARRQNLILKWWKPSSKTNPKLTADNVQELLSDKTRLVTFTHASNILGTIHDVKAISQVVRAKSPNALIVVDAVAYAPHRALDVKDLGVDVYSFSWYKVYGPHMAVMYASAKAQAQMTSLGHYFNPHATLANKIGLAGSSYELVAAIPAVAEYLAGKAEAIAEHESHLQTTLLEFLNSREDITIYGETSNDNRLRVPTISFRIAGWNSQKFVETVEKGSNFGFRWGHFYSARLVREFLGLPEDGIIRVSMVHYNTVEEVKGLISVFEAALEKGPQ